MTDFSIHNMQNLSLTEKYHNFTSNLIGNHASITFAILIILVVVLLYTIFIKCKESLSNPTSMMKWQRREDKEGLTSNAPERNNSYFVSNIQDHDQLNFSNMNCDNVNKTDDDIDAHNYMLSASKETAVGTRTSAAIKNGTITEDKLSLIMAGH